MPLPSNRNPIDGLRSPVADSLPKGTPLWESLGADKQEQVFQAAVGVFAEQGYQAASMNALVRRAGISKGSLFTYFRSKSGLFDAIVQLAVGRVREDLRALRESTRTEPFSIRLEALARTGFDFLEAHPRLARIYFRLLRGGDAPLGRQQLEALRRRSQDFLQELIQAGVDRGELRADLAPERLAFLLNLQLETLLCAWQDREHVGESAQEREREREAWLNGFLSLMLQGMTVPSAMSGTLAAHDKEGTTP